MHRHSFVQNEDENDSYYNMLLTERKRFLWLVRKNGIKILICGHAHKTEEIVSDNLDFVIYTVAGTAKAFDNLGFGYRILMYIKTE